MTDTHSESLDVPPSAKALLAVAAATDARVTGECPTCNRAILSEARTFGPKYQCPHGHSFRSRNELAGLRWWHGRLPSKPAFVLMAVLYLVVRWRHGDGVMTEALPDG